MGFPHYTGNNAQLASVSDMRRSKEIMLLLALLLSAMAFVLWYVIDRRAKLYAHPPAMEPPVRPALK